MGPLRLAKHKARAGWYAAKDAADRAGTVLMAWFTAACIRLAFAWGVIAEFSRHAWFELSEGAQDAWMWAAHWLQHTWAWIQHVVSRLRPGNGASPA